MDNYNGYYRPQINMPPVVKNLLIINVMVFITQMLLPASLKGWFYNTFALSFPIGIKTLYQTVSYMFMHANFSHLLFNMFALWMFGRIVEYDLGSKRFLTYYLICGVGAGLIQIGVNFVEIGSLVAQGYTHLPRFSTVGASGAVFGLLLAYGMLHPNNIIMLMFPPVALKAKWFVVIYGALELFGGVASSGSNVAHFAHLGGMLFGLLLLRYWKKKHKIWY
ncbi:MAG: rhomboid family intramembrane serine protease [Tidjanibacter sp.]|nr:rhomboid family intramembrane serine protease [Tidjanibacter sp.]